MGWTGRATGRANGIFGTLEQLRATRFHVPKITFIVTSPFSGALENEVDLRMACSKKGRIYDLGSGLLKFQNRCQVSGGKRRGSAAQTASR
jgi:hypothetical protein